MKILNMLLVIIAMGILVSCDEQLHTYTIVFDSNEGTSIEEATVTEGKSISEPTLPEKEGFVFLGWYSDSSFLVPFDFSKPVLGNVTLHAKWEPIEYVIRYYTGDQYQELIVEYGDSLPFMNDPYEQGYDFLGWYLDEDGTTSLETNTVVTSDMDIYAMFRDSIAPVIEGVTNVTIYLGTIFDSFEGITVTDNIDGSLTTELHLEGSVNTEQEGSYTLTYSVSDSAGNVTTKERIITVINEPIVLDVFLPGNHFTMTGMMEQYFELLAENYGYTLNYETCNYEDECNYISELLNRIGAGAGPDIYMIENTLHDFSSYETFSTDLSNEEWVDFTEFELVQNGAVIGYPLFVEGYGLFYNEDLLLDAGITLSEIEELRVNPTRSGYLQLFTKVQLYYDSNDMTNHAVVSMATGEYMTWVTGIHGFNAYLAAGLAYNDYTVVDDYQNHTVNTTRLQNYLNWVDLLFTYSDQEILLYGDYNAQVQKFFSGEAAFLHQGNWAEAADNNDFTIGILPYAATNTGTEGIYANSFYYLAINANSEYIEDCKAMLEDLTFTTDGQDLIVNQLGYISPFTNSSYAPEGQMSLAVQEWINNDYMIHNIFSNQITYMINFDDIGTLHFEYAQHVFGDQTAISLEEFYIALKSLIENTN